MGQMFQIIAMQDNVIGSSLQYADSQVTLNEQKIPLGKLVGIFDVSSLGEPDVLTIPQQ